MKENVKSANSKRPQKPPLVPPLSAPSPVAPPATERNLPERIAPKATWRVTPCSPEFAIPGLFNGLTPGNSPWLLAMETRDMLLWRREDATHSQLARLMEEESPKSPVTWHVKL